MTPPEVVQLRRLQHRPIVRGHDGPCWPAWPAVPGLVGRRDRSRPPDPSGGRRQPQAGADQLLVALTRIAPISSRSGRSIPCSAIGDPAQDGFRPCASPRHRPRRIAAPAWLAALAEACAPAAVLIGQLDAALPRSPRSTPGGTPYPWVRRAKADPPHPIHALPRFAFRWPALRPQRDGAHVRRDLVPHNARVRVRSTMRR
jgi:hypothetical protein